MAYKLSTCLIFFLENVSRIIPYQSYLGLGHGHALGHEHGFGQGHGLWHALGHPQ